MKPRDAASLSLGLVAASLAIGIGAPINLWWPGWIELLMTVVVVAAFGFAFRFVFARSEASSNLHFAGFFWLAACVATGVAYMLLALADHPRVEQLVFGLVFGTLFGILFAIPLIPLGFVLRRALREPLVDAFDRVLLAGASFVAIPSVLASLYENAHGKGYAGSILVGISTVMFVIVGVKTRTRARWLRAVIAGEAAGWSVVDRFPGDEQLPAIGVRLADPAVLVTGNFAGGPFRASGAFTPVARIDRAGGYEWRSRIAFAGAVVTVIAVIAGWGLR